MRSDARDESQGDASGHQPDRVGDAQAVGEHNNDGGDKWQEAQGDDTGFKGHWRSVQLGG
ncbi:MAG: hypothetical protein AB9891_07105 [Anaerolineaceae bacterium]